MFLFIQQLDKKGKGHLSNPCTLYSFLPSWPRTEAASPGGSLAPSQDWPLWLPHSASTHCSHRDSQAFNACPVRGLFWVLQVQQ